MYIGFLEDQKTLKLLIQQEKKILCIKTKKKRKKRKRKYVKKILLTIVFVFGPLNNVSAKTIDYNKTTYKTVTSKVISKDLSGGAFSARPLNMDIR